MLTNKQVEDRKLGIGGSDVPVILGLSTYKTPYELYLEKIGAIENKFKMTEQQYWGHQLEPIVRIEFAKRNNVEIQAPKEQEIYKPLCNLISYELDTMVHPFYDHIRANIDGFIPSRNAVFEAKCANQFKWQEWGIDGSDIIPLAYLVQVAHYVAVTNAKEANIAVFMADLRYKEYKYVRDLSLEKDILSAANDFWKSINDKMPPEAINTDDLRLKFSKHKDGKKISANENITKSLGAYFDVELKMKELEAQQEQYKFQIMDYMKDAECLIDMNDKSVVTWKANKNGVRVFKPTAPKVKPTLALAV